MNTVTLLVQAALVFINPNTGARHAMKPSAKPQQAPEWVTTTETYKAAFSQGLVYAINYVVPPPQEVAPKKTNEVQVGFQPQQSMSLESLMAAGMSFETAAQALKEMGIRKQTPGITEVPAPLEAPKSAAKNEIPVPPGVPGRPKKAPNLHINANA